MSRKLFTDRRFAAGLLALVILVFTPLGAKMSLQRAVDKVESGLGLDEYMADSINAARNLITLGSSLGLEAETGALRDAMRTCQSLDEDDTVAQKAEANRALAAAFESLRSAIAGLELAERDAESLEIYVNSFAGPQAAMGRSGYNDSVREFTDNVYNKFPTRQLGSLLDVEPPEYFG